MLISPAYAQAAGDTGGGMLQLLPLVLIFVVFYFLLIRPQQKKAKMHRTMVEAVKRGDKVITGGGLVGTVTKSPEGNEKVLPSRVVGTTSAAVVSFKMRRTLNMMS